MDGAVKSHYSELISLFRNAVPESGGGGAEIPHPTLGVGGGKSLK
jgi:hypothetical protein